MTYEESARALNTFGQRIRTLRVKKGWTQAELASRLSVSDKAVSKWECGHGYPDLLSILQIGNLFEVTMDFLLLGIGEEAF